MNKANRRVEQFDPWVLHDVLVDWFGMLHPQDESPLGNKILLQDECIIQFDEWGVNSSQRRGTLVHQNITTAAFAPIRRS
eukprot:13800_4